ncbi:MAG: carboxypeptidase regulatory-like domain-containing protein [Elusimicrobiales bacterium]
MLKMNKLSILAAGLLALALPPAARAQQLPGTLVIDDSLANGTTVFLTPAYTWQSDDWSKESNIARDPAGNVYIAGTFSPDSGSTQRPFIRKISPAGVTLWTSTVSNTANPSSYADYGRSVALSPDAAFVYLLSVRENSGGTEVVVNKYSAAGVEQWAEGGVAYTGGWGNNAYDITADNNFAYVAGTSQNDIAIFRFQVGDGTPETPTIFNGGDSYNVAYAIHQNLTHLALAGTIYDGRDYNDPSDLEYGNEIWVAKYDKSDMTQVWASTYTSADHPEWGNDEAHAVKIDANGNVYAAGFYYSYDSGSDIWLGKFDTAGNLVFAKIKNGLSNGYDKGFGLARDAAGNIYVTGKLEAYNINQGDNVWVGKYSPAGALLSEVTTHRNHESGYDVEAASHVVVVGGAFDDSYGVLVVAQEQFGELQQLMAGPGWAPGSVRLFWNYESSATVYGYEVEYATYPTFALGAGLGIIAGTDSEVSIGDTKDLDVNGLPVRLDHTVWPNNPEPLYYFKVRIKSDAGAWTPLNNTASAVPNAPYNYWNYSSRGQDSFWVFNSAMAPSSALARDAAGNTYIAYGNMMGGVAMVKMDQYGSAQWTSFYNYAGYNGRFVVNRIKLDGAGNIYAVGSIDDQVPPDYTSAWIAKFNALGVKVWDAVEPGMNSDGNTAFNALAFDSAGKVYAGGENNQGNGDTSMFLVKYEPANMAPNPQVIDSTNENPSSAPDAIWGLAVDASSTTIYAGGYFSVIGTAIDRNAAIVKFNTSLGVTGTASYPNAQTAAAEGWDVIADLLVDNGNVYVAGQKNMNVALSTTSFWVAKIDADTLGITWSDAYNSADDLDAAAYGLRLNGGYLYAAGYENRLYMIDGQKNMVLRKYDLDGTAQWTKAIDGTYQNESALSYGLEVGSDGYFYLAGVFNIWGTEGEGNPGIARVTEPQSGLMARPGHKPSSARLSWVATTELPEDTEFYVYYSTGGQDFLFDAANPQYRFTNDYTLFTGDYLDRLVPGLESGTGAPVPGGNNIDTPTHYFRLGYQRPGDAEVTIVEGSTNTVPNTPGAWDRSDRYPNGNLFLVNNAHGGRNPLVRDAAGNIYTAGTISPWGPGSAAAYVRKFTSAGVPVWTRFWSDQYEQSQPVINALALDGQGNLYAAGSAGSDGSVYYPVQGFESETKRDALVIKYSVADGRMQWARTYDLQLANGNDEINAVAAGPEHVYIAGKFYNSGTETEDSVVVKLGSEGVPSAAYFGALNGDDVFHALAYDPFNDRVYAAGRFHDGATLNGFLKTLSTTSLTDMGLDIIVDKGYEDEVYAVRVDTDNAALYLAGAVSADSAAQDAWLGKYAYGASVPAWERRYNSANENDDEAYGIALDGLGGVYLSGVESRYDINQGKNVFIRKYNTAGDLIWAQALNSAGSNDDHAGGIETDPARGVYAAADAGAMAAAAYYNTYDTISGAGFFKHVQSNMDVTNPRLTVRVNSGPDAGLQGVRVAVMGFSSTGGIDPNGIAMDVTNSSGACTFSLPGGKSYFVAVSSHNMVPTIKDQLSDPGANFFVDLNADTTRQYFITPRAAAADAVYKMTLNVSTVTGTLEGGDYVMGEVFIMQTGERVGYSVIEAIDMLTNPMEIYNLPAAANGVYGMAVSVPARNKVLQLFMNGPFPSTGTYLADMAQASQLAASFEVGGSTVPPSVAGMVLDTNWSPIEGARVKLERYTCTGIPPNSNCTPVFNKETLTDAGGSFSFYNVPFSDCANMLNYPANCTSDELMSLNYNLNVGKAGYESDGRSFPLPEGSPLPYMGDPMNPGMSTTFNLDLATYTLSGILKYNGMPLPNATILVNPDWMSYDYTSDSASDTYRQGEWGNGLGIRSNARVRTAADGSFTVPGLTDGNARIEAVFEGGWRSLNEGAVYSDGVDDDDLRVVISSQGARGPGLPFNNACRPGRTWVINSSGTCVTAGNVAFNIVPEGANNDGQLYGTVTFVTTYTITGTTPLVISTSSPLTLMAQETCRDGCQNSQMSFASLAGTFTENTTSYAMELSTGATYYTRVFSTDWAQANSFKSEVSPSESLPSIRQDFSVVRAGGLRGVLKMPDGSNFRPVWGDESSPTAYWTDVVVQGVNVDTREDRQLDEYGEFEFQNLAPGTYEVYLRPSGAGFVWTPVRQAVTVTEGRTAEVKLQLENGLAVQPQIFGLPEISTPSWNYSIIGVPSGTEMNQKKVTELFFSEPEYAFNYSTSTGWTTKYMPSGQYDFYLLLGANYDPGGGERNIVSYQLFANFIGRVRGVAVQKSDSNPLVGTAAQPIAINILGSIGQGGIAGTIEGDNIFTDSDLDRMFANFEQTFEVIPAMMLYDSAGDLRGFSSGMPGSESSFNGFMAAMAMKSKPALLAFLAANPLDYGVWGLPPGRYTAVFNNPNYPPVAKEVLDITAPGADITAFNFDDEEVVTAGISGVVKSSATGEALAGARVYLRHRTVEKFTLTDSSGAFTLSNLPTGIFRLEVTRNGYVTAGRKTSLAANDAESFTLYLLPSESKITGRVFMSKFPTQVTRAGVEIVVYDETLNVLAPESYLPKTEAQTDASGNFEITGVVPGHLYKLSAFSPGKLPEVLDVTAQEGNTVLSDLTLKDIPPQIAIKVKKSADSASKVDVVIKSPKQLMTAPSCSYNNGQDYDAASAVTLALVPGPNRTYLGQFTVSSSQQYYTVKVTAGDAGNKMEKLFVYDQVSNAKTEQYIQQESLAGGSVQMDRESEEYSGIELDPGALSYSTGTAGTVDYSNLVGGFFSALPSVRTVKTDKGSLTISAALQDLMASEVYNMDLSNASANKPFTLTLKYDKERGAAHSQRLRIYQQDDNGNWNEVPGNYTVDPMLGVLSVDVASLSNATEGTGASATPLGRKRYGMSAVVNGRYRPSTTAATSQSGKFAVFTANPPTGTAAYSTGFEVVNMPNPFNLKSKNVDLSTDIGTSGVSDPYPTTGTVIKYNLPAGKSGTLKFVIYNLAGEKVRTLDEGHRDANQILYSEWDGKNDANQDCASGVYFMLTYLDGKKLGNKAHKMAIIK